MMGRDDRRGAGVEAERRAGRKSGKELNEVSPCLDEGVHGPGRARSRCHFREEARANTPPLRLLVSGA